MEPNLGHHLSFFFVCNRLLPPSTHVPGNQVVIRATFKVHSQMFCCDANQCLKQHTSASLSQRLLLILPQLTQLLLFDDTFIISPYRGANTPSPLWPQSKLFPGLPAFLTLGYSCHFWDSRSMTVLEIVKNRTMGIPAFSLNVHQRLCHVGDALHKIPKIYSSSRWLDGSQQARLSCSQWSHPSSLKKRCFPRPSQPSPPPLVSHKVTKLLSVGASRTRKGQETLSKWLPVSSFLSLYNWFPTETTTIVCQIFVQILWTDDFKFM